MKTYLDYNATAPLRPEVVALMQELLPLPLNASSVHGAGRKAKSLIEDARRSLAEVLGAFANEIVFTASGTEANNWALRAYPDRKIFVSAIEHSSVLKAANATIIPVTTEGVVDVEKLDSVLSSSCAKAQDLRPAHVALDPAVKPQDDGSFLVSVMLANNETGVIQPVADIARIVHAKGGLLHVDAVQAFGKIPLDFTALGADLMTISAHKMGGPVGAGALLVRNNLAIAPMLTGGGQEINRRAGTENIAAIAGFAKAAELIDFAQMKNLRGWLDALETEITKAGGKIIGTGARLPNTSCIAMPGMSAEIQLIDFDLGSIAVSAGSACSSGRIEASHVLRAMNISPEMASTAIRVSGGWATTKPEIDAFSTAWKRLSDRKNKA